MKLPNGSIYEGQFVGGKIYGYGRVVFSDAYYIGWFVNGLTHGEGKIVRENGEIEEGKFENNRFVGPL